MISLKKLLLCIASIRNYSKALIWGFWSFPPRGMLFIPESDVYRLVMPVWGVISSDTPFNFDYPGKLEYSVPSSKPAKTDQPSSRKPKRLKSAG